MFGNVCSWVVGREEELFCLSTDQNKPQIYRVRWSVVRHPGDLLLLRRSYTPLSRSKTSLLFLNVWENKASSVGFMAGDRHTMYYSCWLLLSLSFQWQRRGSQDRIQNLLPQYDCTIISLINPPVGVYRGEVNVNGVSCRPEGLLRPSNHQQCSAEGKVSTPCKKTILLEHPDLSLSLSLSLQRKIIKYPEEWRLLSSVLIWNVCEEAEEERERLKCCGPCF